MSTIQQGLLITLIGMGLVFAVIIFLWGVMSLVVRTTSKNQTTTEEQPEHPVVIPAMQKAEGQRRAAAAAAAVQLLLSACERDAEHFDGQDQSGGLTPWQNMHRLGQLHQSTRRG
jgi:Na+-transporting methylmalonyl-CoA/oxaloacetate decarboxylase gamma subunit